MAPDEFNIYLHIQDYEIQFVTSVRMLGAKVKLLRIAKESVDHVNVYEYIKSIFNIYTDVNKMIVPNTCTVYDKYAILLYKSKRINVFIGQVVSTLTNININTNRYKM